MAKSQAERSRDARTRRAAYLRDLVARVQDLETRVATLELDVKPVVNGLSPEDLIKQLQR